MDFITGILDFLVATIVAFLLATAETTLAFAETVLTTPLGLIGLGTAVLLLCALFVVRRVEARRGVGGRRP